MYLSLQKIASLCGGSLSHGSNPELMIDQVVIDSREVKPGSLFVAICGNKNDGHNFVKDILKAATASIVEKSKNLQFPNLIYVADTTKALGDLAANYRQLQKATVVGITGSNGKTTVKEMLKNICNIEFGSEAVLATSGNLNNHWGMPLTLCQLNSKHKIAIIEMGMNHAGEINYLTQIAKPDIAVVNNVMRAHAGFFKNLADIAVAKGEIYNGLTAGKIACINMADAEHSLWLKQLEYEPLIKQYHYGTPDSQCYLKDTAVASELLIATPQGEIKTSLQVLGVHNKFNALSATVLALNLGCSLVNIAKGLASYTGYKRRLERKTAFNGALIIDDSYNANPDSVKAAILAIRDLPKPHWMIFADLVELGEFSQSAHQEIGEFAYANGIDVFLSVGSLSKTSSTAFAGQKLHFAANWDVVEYCIKNLPANATLLVKGSNLMALDKVVAKLVLL